jgi:CRP-like cAMP-binding protein
MDKVNLDFQPKKSSQLSGPDSAEEKPGSRRLTASSRKFFLRRNPHEVAAEGYEKLKTRLLSHGLAEAVVAELIEHHTLLNYLKGSMIFRQGAPAHLIYWVSSGLVDLLCPAADGSQIEASLLGPGDIFGFIQAADGDGRWGQAFQARARPNVQLGLITRDRVSKVLSRLEPPLLVQLLGEIDSRSMEFVYLLLHTVPRHELQRAPRDRAPRSGE